MINDSNQAPLWRSPIPFDPGTVAAQVQCERPDGTVDRWRLTALRRECVACRHAQAAAYTAGEPLPPLMRAKVALYLGDGTVSFYCAQHAIDHGWKGRA